MLKITEKLDVVKAGIYAALLYRRSRRDSHPTILLNATVLDYRINEHTKNRKRRRAWDLVYRKIIFISLDEAEWIIILLDII